MNIGVQDAKAMGIEWIRAEIAKWSEDINRDPNYMKVLEVALSELLEQSLPEMASEPILSAVDGLPLESYTKDIDSAVLIRCEVESLIEGINKANDSTVAELKEKLRESEHRAQELFKRNVELDKEATESFEECSELERQNVQLILERDEALKCRDNAAKEIEAMKQELEAARVEVSQSREVKAQTEAERTAEQEAARQRFLNSRIKVSNVRWEDDFKKTHKLANLADTGEEIRYHYLEHGKYTEITAEEAEIIRAMNQPLEMPTIGAQTEESFRSEAESLSEAQPGADSADYGGEESAVGADETFEQWATREINALKSVVYGVNSKPLGAGNAFEEEVA